MISVHDYFWHSVYIFGAQAPTLFEAMRECYCIIWTSIFKSILRNLDAIKNKSVHLIVSEIVNFRIWSKMASSSTYTGFIDISQLVSHICAKKLFSDFIEGVTLRYLCGDSLLVWKCKWYFTSKKPHPVLLPVGSTWLISCRYKRKKPLKLLILFRFVRFDSRLRYAGTLTSGFIAFLISTISIIVRIGLLLLWSGDFHHFQVVINNKHTNEGIKIRFPIIIR